jgi:hypothetical protein
MQSMINRGALVRRPTSASQVAVPGQPGGYVTSFPYYSTVVFRAAAGSATGYGYVFPQGQERKAFAYAEGQEWTIGGATTALDGRATFAETNLTKANETIAGESLEIMGLAIQVQPAVTDGLRFMQARLLAMIATNVSVELSLNGGSNSFKLGTLGQIPSAGGLVGSGLDNLSPEPTVNAIQERGSERFDFAQNGWQVRSNFYRLPEGLIWRPAGEVDSMLQVIFRNAREFSLFRGGDPENAADDSQTPPSVHPEYIAVVLKIHLIGRQLSQRSAVR